MPAIPFASNTYMLSVRPGEFCPNTFDEDNDSGADTEQCKLEPRHAVVR